MKSPKFREVKVPMPALTIVVTPFYGDDRHGSGLVINATISMDLLEGILESVAKTQTKASP